MRDCNKCVYSTRDGNCRKWECKGTVTVEDIKKEAIKDFAEWLDNNYETKNYIPNLVEFYEKEQR